MRQCRRFLGIDFVQGMLKDSSRLKLEAAGGEPARFVAADACHLPVRSQSFTKVYCSAVIHTLPSRAHGRAVIDELIRVTARGGQVLVCSVPDQAKSLSSRLEIWKRAGWRAKMTLPIRWMVPSGTKQLLRRVLHLPSTELPEFLEYDLRQIARELEARGLSCEIRDFPADYWNREFRISRSNLLIQVP